MVYSQTYSLFYIKQPGTQNYPLTVQLQTDGAFKLQGKEVSPVLYDSGITQDKEIKVGVLRVK